MTTPRLGAPTLVAGQAVPETTVNEQIRYIEAGAGHFIFIDRDLAAPPASPADGDCYLVAASPTGAWAGRAGRIAFRVNTAWAFITPREGFTAWVNDENVFVGFDGSAWLPLSTPVGTYLPLAGGNLSGDLTVPDEAYDATAWNGSLEVPTKNAVRDKIEALVIPSAYTDEQAQDAVAAALAAGTHTNVTVTYDDAAGSISLAATGGSAAPPLTVEATSSTAYTFALADAGKHKRLTAATAIAATVPPNSSVAYPAGTRIRCTAAGAGQVTLAPGSGVTLNSRGGALKSAGQFAVFEIEKVGTDEWDVLGDLAV